MESKGCIQIFSSAPTLKTSVTATSLQPLQKAPRLHPPVALDLSSKATSGKSKNRVVCDEARFRFERCAMVTCVVVPYFQIRNGLEYKFGEKEC